MSGTVLCQKERCHEVCHYLGGGLWRCANGHAFRLSVSNLQRQVAANLIVDDDHDTKSGE